MTLEEVNEILVGLCPYSLQKAVLLYAEPINLDVFSTPEAAIVTVNRMVNLFESF
jgi:hypothetical protein